MAFQSLQLKKSGFEIKAYIENVFISYLFLRVITTTAKLDITFTKKYDFKQAKLWGKIF